MPTTGAKPLNSPGADHEQALADALGRLSKWFKKLLDLEQKAEYWRALQWIPAEALEEITQAIIEDNPPTPGRFPTINQIKTRWFDWQATHPSKRADYAKIDCPVCQSEFGLLNGAREEGGITYRVVARCAACENWLAHFPRDSKAAPLMRPEQLEAQGYVLEYPPKAPARPQPVKQLASQVGGHLNPGRREEYFNKRRSAP